MSARRAGIVYADFAAVQLDAVHLLNGPRRRLNIPHRDETKATRATSACIVYDHNLVDIADAGKLVL